MSASGPTPPPAPARRRSGPAGPAISPAVGVLLGLALTLLLVACGELSSGSETSSGTSPTVEPSSTVDRPVDDGPGTGADPDPVTDEPVSYEPVIVGTYPHDPDAYTQGLEFVGELLLESTGLTGESSIRLVEPTTGDVVDSAPVGGDLFAEGTTVVGREIYQLTWQDEILLIRSVDDLAEQRRVSYGGEGWGLCATDQRLIMSNGSDRLTFRHRQTFEELGSVTVTDRGRPVENLNELECVGDRVWANIWQSDRLVSIDPSTGAVDGVVDLSSLVPEDVIEADSDNVANGVAYNRETGRFWLTGKRWPVMYEVELRAVS
ncbi:MAG: glutaminyl-peptide cyclotransferase [Acidimicrobiales bacterium]